MNPRLDVIVACGDEMQANLDRTIKNLRRSIGPQDRIIVVFDAGQADPHPGADVSVFNTVPLGCGGSRHVGVLEAKAEYIAFADAHMDFPDGWADRAVAHLEAHPNDITCAKMQSIDWDWKDINGQRYAGAHMTQFQIAPVCEAYPFSGRWNRTDIGTGEIGCLMGACYAMRRARYHDIGAPLQYLRKWGMDEEILSMGNWMLGGRVWLMDDLARHMYAAPRNKQFPLSNGDAVRVWSNRLFCVLALPMSEPLREQYMKHLLNTSFVAVNWKIIKQAAESRQPHILRERLATGGRGIEEYMAMWSVSGETPEEIEMMKRRSKADAKRTTKKPAAPVPSVEPQPAAPVQPVAEQPDAVKLKQYMCVHCGHWSKTHKIRAAYPNGRVNLLCEKCAASFMSAACRNDDMQETSDAL